MFNFDNYLDKRLVPLTSRDVSRLLRVEYVRGAMSTLLTPTQYTYLQHSAAGTSQRDIARLYSVAPCTVSRTLSRAHARLELYCLALMTRCDLDPASDLYNVLLGLLRELGAERHT